MLNKLTPIGPQWPPTDTDPDKHLCFLLLSSKDCSGLFKSPFPHIICYQFPKNTAVVVAHEKDLLKQLKGKIFFLFIFLCSSWFLPNDAI